MRWDIERWLRSLPLRRPSVELDARVGEAVHRDRVARRATWLAAASAVAATAALGFSIAAFFQATASGPVAERAADEAVRGSRTDAVGRQVPRRERPRNNGVAPADRPGGLGRTVPTEPPIPRQPAIPTTTEIPLDGGSRRQ